MALMYRLHLLALDESNDGPESTVCKIFSAASDVDDLIYAASTRRLFRT